MKETDRFGKTFHSVETPLSIPKYTMEKEKKSTLLNHLGRFAEEVIILPSTN